MTLALDGSVTANASSGTSLALPGLTTTKTNDVIVVFALVNSASGVISVSSIADTAGLTWTKRAGAGVTSQPLEEWYAISSGILSSDVITVTLSAAVAFLTLSAFAVSGANTTSPWDANVSLPATSSTAAVSVSTTAAATMLIGGYRLSSVAAPGAGAAFTAITNVNFLLTEYEVVSSAQTAKAVPIGGAAATNGGIGDAIVQASVSGTITASIRKPTSSFSGKLNETGTITASIRKPTSSFTGKLNESGTVTASIRKPTSSFAGLLNESGTVTASIRKPTSSFAGLLNESGTVTASIRKPTSSFAGLLNESGTITTTLRKPVSSFTGKLNESGTLAASIRKPASSFSGTTVSGETGTITASIRKPTSSFTGKLNETATLSASIRKPASSFSGTTASGEVGTITASIRKPTSNFHGVQGLELIGSITASIRKPTASMNAVIQLNHRPFVYWIGPPLL
jgi:hypothetical protein